MAYAVKIYAHRGLWLPNYPENSVEAFRAAKTEGFVSECDVWESADGEPVVNHDDTLNRTTTGVGKISDFTALELGKLSCKIGQVSEGLLSPPMLGDVASLVSLVEIKQPNSPALVRRVINLMAGRRWTLQSFDPADIQHTLAVAPDLPVALLVHQVEAIDIAIANRWPVHIDQHLLDDRNAGRIAVAGLSLGVWTIQSEAELERVMQWRPTAIITDQPMLVRRLLGRWGIAEAH